MSKKISELTAAGVITGAEQVELVQGGVNVRSTVDAIKNGDVKVYRALLSQSGTNAPVATVLENTLGVTPVFAYVGTGNYSITIAGGFSLTKTIFRSIGNSAYNGGVDFVNFGIGGPGDGADAGVLFFRTQEWTGATISGLNNWGDYLPIEVLVYP